MLVGERDESDEVGGGGGLGEDQGIILMFDECVVNVLFPPSSRFD